MGVAESVVEVVVAIGLPAIVDRHPGHLADHPEVVHGTSDADSKLPLTIGSFDVGSTVSVIAVVRVAEVPDPVIVMAAGPLGAPGAAFNVNVEAPPEVIVEDENEADTPAGSPEIDSATL